MTYIAQAGDFPGPLGGRGASDRGDLSRGKCPWIFRVISKFVNNSIDADGAILSRILPIALVSDALSETAFKSSARKPAASCAVQGAPKTETLFRFTACNFVNVGQIYTKFGNNHGLMFYSQD